MLTCCLRTLILSLITLIIAVGLLWYMHDTLYPVQQVQMHGQWHQGQPTVVVSHATPFVRAEKKKEGK